MLLDSNIVIYAIQPEYESLQTWLFEQDIGVSRITLLEVLGYHRLTLQDKINFQKLFKYTEIYPISTQVIQLAIVLRQQRKMSLGDAIIAATALEYRQTLATRNLKDFDWIENLKIIDPIT